MVRTILVNERRYFEFKSENQCHKPFFYFYLVFSLMVISMRVLDSSSFKIGIESLFFIAFFVVSVGISFILLLIIFSKQISIFLLSIGPLTAFSVCFMLFKTDFGLRNLMFLLLLEIFPLILYVKRYKKYINSISLLFKESSKIMLRFIFPIYGIYLALCLIFSFQCIFLVSTKYEKSFYFFSKAFLIFIYLSWNYYIATFIIQTFVSSIIYFYVMDSLKGNNISVLKLSMWNLKKNFFNFFFGSSKIKFSFVELAGLDSQTAGENTNKDVFYIKTVLGWFAGIALNITETLYLLRNGWTVGCMCLFNICYLKAEGILWNLLVDLNNVKLFSFKFPMYALLNLRFLLFFFGMLQIWGKCVPNEYVRIFCILFYWTSLFCYALDAAWRSLIFIFYYDNEQIKEVNPELYNEIMFVQNGFIEYESLVNLYYFGGAR